MPLGSLIWTRRRGPGEEGVVFEGTAYSGGDVIEVPNDDERDLWVKARWVTVVPQKGKA